MGKLTHLKVKGLKTPGRHADGDTLYLQVGPSGTKCWIQRIVINGKRHDLGLGPWPLVGLDRARRRAFENRVKIEDGIDVLADRRRHSVVPTFERAALQYFEENLPGWKQNRNAARWIHVVRQYAFKAFGSMRVDAIMREDILRLLKPLWATKPEQGRKLKQRVGAILRWCVAHGFTDKNAVELAAGALPRMPAVRQHYRALPYQDIPKALELIEESGASWSSKWCLRFLVLTGSRSIEARGARWPEIDWAKKIWTVPADRMKMKTEHQVPLSAAVVTVLKQAWSLREGDDGLVFPSAMKKGRMLSDMSLGKLLKCVGLADRATVHGMRTGLRTWAEENTSADFAVKEMALSHKVGSQIERSYSRSVLLEKRARLMEAWGRFCTGKNTRKAEVVRLRAGA